MADDAAYHHLVRRVHEAILAGDTAKVDAVRAAMPEAVRDAEAQLPPPAPQGGARHMTTDILSILESLASTKLPADKLATFEPMADRAAAVTARHVAARAEHLATAERIASISSKQLQPRIKPDSWPLVGSLLTAGRELKDTLDGELHEVRDGVRAVRSARTNSEFESSFRQLEKSVKNAENTAGVADRLAARVTELLARIEESVLSASYVVPPAPGEVK
jgi:hypothetical protein